MARYVAKYRRYEHKGIDKVDHETHWQTGKEKHRGIMCRFQHAGLSPWEIAAAMERFQFKGAGHDEDLSHRLSFFDTELEQKIQGWTDQEREQVEERLNSSPSIGVDFILVEKPAPSLPYRSYGKHRKIAGRRTVAHVVEDVKQAIEVAGIDVEAVVAYEREIGGPPELVEALSALTGETEDEPLVAA